MYKYSDNEIKQLLSNIVILIDTREQENSHIIEYFEAKGINYKSQKLDFADYSYMLPAQPDMGIVRDMYFTNEITIERKANLEELSNNLTKDRDRLENEFLRSKGKVYLLIEDPKGYENIITHKYNSRFNPKSFIASLKTFEARYNLNVNYIDKNYSGNFIALTFLYHLRQHLKG